MALHQQSCLAFRVALNTEQMSVPFLKPKVVPYDHYLASLRDIDAARWYSNVGPQNTLFEARVRADLFGVSGDVCTVCNATIGLMLAIKAVRGPGKIALMPSFTFAATALAAEWNGMVPYFYDVREDDWCPNESQLQELVARLGSDVGVVIPYATFGSPMDLATYAALHIAGVPVVVDAASAIGSRRAGKQLGLGFPGLVVYSLHATKVFVIGEGGLVYSADEQLVRQVRALSNFGFNEQRESVSCGLNGKMPEVMAAIASATLESLPDVLDLRSRLYEEYVQRMRDLGLFDRGWQLQAHDGYCSHQFMAALVPTSVTNTTIMRLLEQSGIATRAYFSPPCHQQHQFAGYPAMRLKTTEMLAQRVVALPMWNDMTADDVHLVVSAMSSATEAALRGAAK